MPLQHYYNIIACIQLRPRYVFYFALYMLAHVYSINKANALKWARLLSSKNYVNYTRRYARRLRTDLVPPPRPMHILFEYTIILKSVDFGKRTGKFAIVSAFHMTWIFFFSFILFRLLCGVDVR